MHDATALLLAAAAGTALGAMFFGGLWWTVRQGMVSRRPGLWFMASLLLRMGIALAGLWFIGHRNWERLLACLLGIALGRLIVLALARPAPAGKPHRTVQSSHAP
jgi:F1F0 ATPase subunit 2